MKKRIIAWLSTLFVSKKMLTDVRLQRDAAQKQQRYQHQYKHDDLTSRLTDLEDRIAMLEKKPVLR